MVQAACLLEAAKGLVLPAKLTLINKENASLKLALRCWLLLLAELQGLSATVTFDDPQTKEVSLGC